MLHLYLFFIGSWPRSCRYRCASLRDGFGIWGVLYSGMFILCERVKNENAINLHSDLSLRLLCNQFKHYRYDMKWNTNTSEISSWTLHMFKQRKLQSILVFLDDVTCLHKCDVGIQFLSRGSAVRSNISFSFLCVCWLFSSQKSSRCLLSSLKTWTFS